MKFFKLALIVTSLSSMNLYGGEVDKNTQYLHEGCGLLLKKVKSKDLKLDSSAQSAAAEYCRGFMDGFFDGQNFVISSLNLKSPFCIPDGTLRPVVVQKVVDFFNENKSDVYAVPPMKAVVVAISEKFPCPSSKK